MQQEFRELLSVEYAFLRTKCVQLDEKLQGSNNNKQSHCVVCGGADHIFSKLNFAMHIGNASNYCRRHKFINKWR